MCTCKHNIVIAESVEKCRSFMVLSLCAGQFGKVYKALMKKSTQTVQVAVKVVESISPDFQKEVTIMSEIIHPNIVRLYGLMNEGMCS